MRTYVYVDGFNLYYAIRGTPYRWLNLKLLSQKALPPNCKVEKVKYYTARVSGAVDPDQPRRQQIYLNALKTVKEIEIFFGNFLAKQVWRPLVNLPIANRTISSNPPVTFPEGVYTVGPSTVPPVSGDEKLAIGKYPLPGNNRRNSKIAGPPPGSVRAYVHWMEEKGSDVNLACHLVNDAWKDCFDVAAIVSNDTDLVEPIRIVTKERGKQVILVHPGRWNAAPALVAVANSVRHLHPAMLKAAQFPGTIPGSNIIKPNHW